MDDKEIKGGLDFGEALSIIKLGNRVARAGWNAHHFLEISTAVFSEPRRQNESPFIYMIVGEEDKLMPGALVPWVASQTDLLATDWFQVEE